MKVGDFVKVKFNRESGSHSFLCKVRSLKFEESYAGFYADFQLENETEVRYGLFLFSCTDSLEVVEGPFKKPQLRLENLKTGDKFKLSDDYKGWIFVLVEGASTGICSKKYNYTHANIVWGTNENFAVEKVE